MNRTQIMSKLTKLIPLRKGERLHYEHRPDAPDAEERRTMRLRYIEAKADREEVSKRLSARRDALCAADPEYQAILKEWKDVGAILKDSSGYHRHRIEAGVASSLGGFGTFSVFAQGDTWDEVFKKLEEKPRG